MSAPRWPRVLGLQRSRSVPSPLTSRADCSSGCRSRRSCDPSAPCAEGPVVAPRRKRSGISSPAPGWPHPGKSLRMATPQPESVIQTRGLRRVFKSRKRQVEAVAGVDLDVRQGEIFGFLGPNGAGKTTTLRMLATLLPPSGGTARVAGCELATQPAQIRERIGYVGQAGGADREITIFVTTHYLDEADALCDRVAIIDYGKIVAEGTPEELKRAVAGDVVTLSVAGEQDRALDLIKAQPFVREAKVENGSVHLYVDRGEVAMPAILRLLDAAHMQIVTMELHRPSLDDVFLRQTGRSLRETAA